MKKTVKNSAILMHKIKTLCKNNSFREAFELIESNSHKYDDLFYFLVGYQFSSKGHLEKAKIFFTKAININNRIGVYYFERALMNYGLMLFKEAYDDCLKYSELKYVEEESLFDFPEQGIIDPKSSFILGPSFDLAFEMGTVWCRTDFNRIINSKDFLNRLSHGLMHALELAKTYNLKIVINGCILEQLLDTLKMVIKYSSFFYDNKFADYQKQINEIQILESVELKHKLDPKVKYLWFTAYNKSFSPELGYHSVNKNIVFWCVFFYSWSAGKMEGTPYLTKPFENYFHRNLDYGINNLKKYNRFITKELKKC